ADGDGDHVGDACDPCTGGAPATKDKLTASKLLAPSGDEKLSLKGEAVIPPTPTLDPLSNGVRILLTSATGATLLDITIPPGAYNVQSKTGWIASGTSWTFKAPGPSTVGIQKVSVKRNGSVPNGIKFSIKGKNAVYSIGTLDVPVGATLVLDVPTAVGGQCVEMTFPAAPPASPSCVLKAPGATLKCK